MKFSEESSSLRKLMKAVWPWVGKRMSNCRKFRRPDSDGGNSYRDAVPGDQGGSKGKGADRFIINPETHCPRAGWWPPGKSKSTRRWAVRAVCVLIVVTDSEYVSNVQNPSIVVLPHRIRQRPSLLYTSLYCWVIRKPPEIFPRDFNWPIPQLVAET